MSAPSFAVVRVVYHNGVALRPEHMSLAASVAMAALVVEGEYMLMPDLTLAEVDEWFENEVDAHAHRETLVRKAPGQDFRTVCVADVP